MLNHYDDDNRVALLLQNLRNRYGYNYPAVLGTTLWVIGAFLPEAPIWDEPMVWNAAQLAKSLLEMEKELRCQ